MLDPDLPRDACPTSAPSDRHIGIIRAIPCRVGAVTQEDVPLQLRRWVDPLGLWETPWQGATSDVVLVGSAAFKRCADPRYLAWAEREIEVLTALRGTEVPHARLLDHARVETDEGAQVWLVLQRALGVDLEVMRDREPAQREAWMRQLGEMLARMHATPVPAALDVAEPWLERMFADAENNLEWCDGTPELLQQLRATTPPVVPEVLIHGDFNLSNVIAHRGPASQGQLTTIDWSSGTRGDPRFDLALAIAADPDVDLAPTEIDAFYSGYGSAPLSPSELRWFVDLYEFA